MSYILCYDVKNKLIGEYRAPFDMEVDCYNLYVVGYDFSEMNVRGRCKQLWFEDVNNFNEVDLSGFMNLEISILEYCGENGILKTLELNCKKIESNDFTFNDIMNKYVQEEPDPSMRDIQGCKYELAINGYKDKL